MYNFLVIPDTQKFDHCGSGHEQVNRRITVSRSQEGRPPEKCLQS